MTSHGIPDGSRSARYILKDYVKVNNLTVSFASQDLYASSAYKSMHLLFIGDFFSHWHTYGSQSPSRFWSRIMFLCFCRENCCTPSHLLEKTKNNLNKWDTKYRNLSTLKAKKPKTKIKFIDRWHILYNIVGFADISRICTILALVEQIQAIRNPLFFFSYWNYLDLTMKKRLLSHLLRWPSFVFFLDEWCWQGFLQTVFPFL